MSIKSARQNTIAQYFGPKGFPQLQPTAMDDQLKPPVGSLLERIAKSEAQKLELKTNDLNASPRDPKKQTLVLPSHQLHFAKQIPFEADATIFKQELDKAEQMKALRIQEEREERERQERRRHEEKKKEEHRAAMAKLMRDQIQKEKDEKDREIVIDKAVGIVHDRTKRKTR